MASALELFEYWNISKIEHLYKPLEVMKMINRQILPKHSLKGV